jgi:hypothetical protein
MMRFVGLIVVALSILAAPMATESAQITTAPAKDANDLSVITIEGRIVSGDAQQFTNAASQVPSGQNTVVILDSGGGTLVDALQIGEAIHAQGLSTFVPDGVVCASACANIWLAGRKRLIAPNGRVGFHAAYDRDGHENGQGNAIIGAYLTRLGLNYNAIAFMTEADPESMSWLTKQKADELGIGYDVVDLGDAAKRNAPEPFIPQGQSPAAPAPAVVAPPAAPMESPSQLSLQQAVETWLKRYFAAGNLPNNAQTPQKILSWYYMPLHKPDGFTTSFKKLVHSNDLVAEKYKFITRWPIRNYRVRPGTVTVSPQPQTGWLDVTGIVDWTCSAPDRGQATSIGSEQFSFELFDEGGGHFTIIAEDAQILTRTVSGGTR